MPSERPKPIWVRVIAGALAWAGLSNAFLLSLASFDKSLFPNFPLQLDGASAAMIHWCLGLMSAAFLLAGGALFFFRKIALPTFAAGLLFYFGYVTSAFLIPLFEAMQHSAGRANRPAGSFCSL
ncbi:MAG: hypothetical protein JOZ72_03530 [Alphaproteobacteria bacterium]|nr:hypothetical protein [Alphaproteobacteria bacterium]